MKKTTGKTAFITGSASGIGPGIVKAFISACMQVVIADLRKNHIDEAMAFFKSTAQMDKVVISSIPLQSPASTGGPATSQRNGIETTSRESLSRQLERIWKLLAFPLNSA